MRGADRRTTTAPRDPRPFIMVSQAAGRPWNLILEQNVRSARALPEGSKPRGTIYAAVGVAGLVISFAAGW